MPSDREDAYRRRLRARAADELGADERVVAMLPFASVAKLPRVKPKVRTGIRQSWRRYRPTVVTNRRVLVFDSGRTPQPRELLGTFPIGDVEMGDVEVGRFGASVFVLELPGVGRVPYETGRREADDVTALSGVLHRTVS